MGFSTKRMLGLACLFSAFTFCAKESVTPDVEKPSNVVVTSIDDLDPLEETVNSHVGYTGHSSVKMNFRSYREIGKNETGEDFQHYPRLKKMRNGRYILFFQRGTDKSDGIGNSVSYAISPNLRNWKPMGKLFAPGNVAEEGKNIKRYYANCDAAVLKNGNILAVASYRGDNYINNKQHDGLVIRRSFDNGLKWTEPVVIYKGTVTWEPYLLELENGEIQCYFTNSKNLTETNRQDTGVSMITSKDGGVTWSEPEDVIRMIWYDNGQKKFNHQMPCVIQLNNSKELAAVVESHPGKNYYISLAYSDENGEWDDLSGDKEGPTHSLNKYFRGCAPYLLQFPSGETLVSYNTGGFHLKSGDEKAEINKEWDYTPFPDGGFWGSICLESSHKAIGVIPHHKKSSIILAEMILNHRIKAEKKSIDVDGDGKDWGKNNHALFIGDKTQAQAILRTAYDDKRLYFIVDVLDLGLTKSQEDYISVYLSSSRNNELNEGSLKINITATGLKNMQSYSRATWRKFDSSDIKVSTQCNATEKGRKGYVAEILIPKERLGSIQDEFYVNLSMVREGKEIDAIQPSDLNTLEHWIPIVINHTGR